MSRVRIIHLPPTTPKLLAPLSCFSVVNNVIPPAGCSLEFRAIPSLTFFFFPTHSTVAFFFFFLKCAESHSVSSFPFPSPRQQLIPQLIKTITFLIRVSFHLVQLSWTVRADIRRICHTEPPVWSFPSAGHFLHSPFDSERKQNSNDGLESLCVALYLFFSYLFTLFLYQHIYPSTFLCLCWVPICLYHAFYLA